MFPPILDFAITGNETDLREIGLKPPEFTAPTSTSTFVLSIVYIVLMLSMNILIVAAFVVERRLRSYNNYFIINLVIADLLVGVSLVVGLVSGCGPSQGLLCKLSFGANDGLLSVSVISIVVICADRHRATFSPIKHFTTRSMKKAMILSSLSWLIAFGFWLPFTVAPVLDFIAPALADNLFALRVLTSMTPITIMVFVPIVIITVLYAMILAKIRLSMGAKHVKAQFGLGDAKPNSGGGEKTGKSKRDQGDGQSSGERIALDHVRTANAPQKVSTRGNKKKKREGI